MKADFDVAIIGGGPNGAVAAALLARHGGITPARIALIAPELAAGTAPSTDKPPAKLPQPSRVAAISRASEIVLHNAQAWSLLDQERICAYQSMRVWHESVPSDGPEALVFSAAEVAEPNLGYIVENRALSGAGLASFRAQGGQVLGVRSGRPADGSTRRAPANRWAGDPRSPGDRRRWCAFASARVSEDCAAQP